MPTNADIIQWPDALEAKDVQHVYNCIHKSEWPTKVSLVWLASTDVLDIKYPKDLLSVCHPWVDLLPSPTDIKLVPTCRYLTLHFIGTRTYKIICRLHRYIWRSYIAWWILMRPGGPSKAWGLKVLWWGVYAELLLLFIAINLSGTNIASISNIPVTHIFLRNKNALLHLAGLLSLQRKLKEGSGRSMMSQRQLTSETTKLCLPILSIMLRAHSIKRGNAMPNWALHWACAK